MDFDAGDEKHDAFLSELSCHASADETLWRDLVTISGDFDVDRDLRWQQMSSSVTQHVSFTIYARLVKDKAGLREFCARGWLRAPRDEVFAVNADVQHRAQWDTTCAAVAELSSCGPEPGGGPFLERHRLLHWGLNYDLPWPLGQLKRDYVFAQTNRSITTDHEQVVRCIHTRTLSSDFSSKVCPVQSGRSRITDHTSCMAIWAGETDLECNFAMSCFEDGSVLVPNAILARAATAMMACQLTTTVAVAKRYSRRRMQNVLWKFGIATDGKCPRGLAPSVEDRALDANVGTGPSASADGASAASDDTDSEWDWEELSEFSWSEVFDADVKCFYFDDFEADSEVECQIASAEDDDTEPQTVGLQGRDVETVGEGKHGGGYAQERFEQPGQAEAAVVKWAAHKSRKYFSKDMVGRSSRYLEMAASCSDIRFAQASEGLHSLAFTAEKAASRAFTSLEKSIDRLDRYLVR